MSQINFDVGFYTEANGARTDMNPVARNLIHSEFQEVTAYVSAVEVSSLELTRYESLELKTKINNNFKNRVILCSFSETVY